MANPSMPAPEGYIGPGVYEVKDVDIKPDRRAVSLMYDEPSSVAKVRDLGDMIPYVKDKFLFPYNDSTWPKVLIIMYEDRGKLAQLLVDPRHEFRSLHHFFKIRATKVEKTNEDINKLLVRMSFDDVFRYTSPEKPWLSQLNEEDRTLWTYIHNRIKGLLNFQVEATEWAAAQDAKMDEIREILGVSMSDDQTRPDNEAELRARSSWNEAKKDRLRYLNIQLRPNDQAVAAPAPRSSGSIIPQWVHTI